MDGKKESLRLLKEHGTEERHNKHKAFRVNGHLIVITETKTDARGWMNKLCEIRRAIRLPAPVFRGILFGNDRMASQTQAGA
jgi:hypothetical protein